MNDDTLNDLLDRWQDEFAAGRDTPVNELCPDRPHLAAELQQRITRLRRFHALADVPAEGQPAPATVHVSRSDTPQPIMIGGVEVAASSVRVGQDLAGFRLLRLLGEGGMGQVFEAEELALRRRVALKVMHPHLACRPEARDRFLAEAWAMAAVQHDHVVPIFRVDAASGVPFLAMPLLAGETLSTRLQRTPFPVPQAVRIAREAAQGLAAAHARGLIHRDVKPGNLWLEAPNDRVKVLDFGLARAADGGEGLTQTGALLGTPGYMSPEQIDGMKLDVRTDLFSLGCVLYQMLTGRPAFDGNTAVARAMSVKEQQPPPPAVVNPAVPATLSDLVTRLLEKDRSRRPVSAEEVVAELTALESRGVGSEGGRAEALTPSSSPLTTHHSPLTTRGWLLPAGVVLLAGVVGAWLLIGGRMRPPARTIEPSTGTERAERGPPSSPSYQGSVDLLVQWQEPDGSDSAVPLSDPRAMPLRPGRHIKIVAKVEPAAYLYLFWIDEKGKTLPVSPWALGQWGTRPAEETPTGRREIKAPNGKWLQVTGDMAGMETILLLACPDRLEKKESEIRGWFDGLEPVPLRGERARVWFENFDLVTKEPTRGFSYDADLKKPDTPLAQQVLLGRRIGSAAAFARAISFARLGKDKKRGDD